MSDDKSDKAGGWFDNPLPIVMVVLLAGGLLVKNVPLESARPTDPERVKFVATSQQDVEARLWQDPFAAVEKHKKSSEQAVTLPKNTLMMLFDPTSLNTSSASHRLENLKKKIELFNNVTVVAVSVFGGPYVEDAEARRRSRFAVVSALSFHNYHPENADAVGYFSPDPSKRRSNASEATKPYDDDVPYEWFKKESTSSSVLVLWLKDEQLTKNSLTTLLDLFNKLRPDSHRTVKFIGPAGTAVLSNLFDESLSLLPQENSKIEVYSPGATISNCDLLYPEDGQPQWDCFKNPPDLQDRTTLPIVRTTGTDDVLAAALLWELWQRGVNRELGYVDSWWTRMFEKGTGARKCDDGLVLIGERDTRYGRTLLRYLKDGFSDRCGGKPDKKDKIAGFDKHTSVPVRTFTYLRGLDGVLADADKSSSNAHHKDNGGQSKDLREQLDDAPPEHAEGRNQFDYLRRLADEIDQLDRDREFFAENGVKVIGLVGSDVYDKLLILQALRSRFKDKIFFTTDLDARYLHTDQKDWARNLVVASNFGLSVNPKLQKYTLPFRDSYQTARYLATLIALEDQPLVWTGKMKEWLSPQIFEIGRTETVHLASPSVEELRKWIKNDPPEIGQSGTLHRALQFIERLKILTKEEDTKCVVNLNGDVDWAQCKSIEPARPPRGLSSEQLLKILIMFVLGIFLVALTSGSHIRKVVRTAYRLARAKKFRLKLAALLVLPIPVLIGSVRIMDAFWFPIGTGEPFVWLEGISVWPSLVLRFVCLVTMLVLAYALYFWIRHQDIQISKDFCLGQPGPQTHIQNWWSAVWTGSFLTLVTFDKENKAVPKPTSATIEVEIAILWQNYLRATHWREMKVWILASVLLVFLLDIVVCQVFDNPSFPHRGQLVKWLDPILVHSNALVLWLLIFWVGYETRACARLIKTLSDVRSVWPKRLLDSEEARTGVPGVHFDDYLDFQLIVRATQRIRWLIFLPFISILFMVIARSNIFDAMDFPPPLIFVTGLALAFALHSAILLRRSAESARIKALEHYETRLLRQTRTKDSQPPILIVTPVSAEQIKLLMERIRNNCEGAFAPFAQQPALQALLLPFGGYGSIQIIEYLFKL